VRRKSESLPSTKLFGSRARVRGLLSITTGLLATYATAVRPERDVHHDVQMKEAWDALMQLKAMLDAIKR
jgi:hypothetical protein